VIAALLDTALDRSIVLGYGKSGSALRRRWWPADPEPDALVGKRVLVTGATSGIGEAMCRSFADLGATVHLLGRNAEKTAASAASLRLAVPNAEVVEEICDVGDLDAVRVWAADFADRVGALHGLVHNAGLMTQRRTESRQGHELAFAIHVLGPHLMTDLLRPTLAAGAAQGGGSSVVWMASGGMYGAKLPRSAAGLESRPEWLKGEYDGVQAYARTKRMQVVLADVWADRLAGSGVRVESMHPGWVETPGVATHLPTFNKLTGPILRDAADGADTAVWLVATRPESTAPHFWHDRRQRPTTFGWQRDEDPDAVTHLVEYVAAATGTEA
jgi:dehydrogenase/reductase SDR family protein 12